MASQLQPSNRPKMRPKGVGAKNKTMSKEEQALYDYAISQGIVGEELASFMAQTAHESTGFSKVKESGLSKKNIQDILDGNAPKIDPTGKVRLRFIEDGITASSGAVAANNSRYRDGVGAGNRDYSSGDGSKFAGKGYIQVTGRSNYKKLGETMGVDLVNNPDLLLDRDFARKASVQWWKDNVRPKKPNYADTRAVTKIVNGVYTGLEDREERASAYFRDMADANVNNPNEFDPRKAKFNSFGTEGLTPVPTPSSSAPETSLRPQMRPVPIVSLPDPAVVAESDAQYKAARSNVPENNAIDFTQPVPQPQQPIIEEEVRMKYPQYLADGTEEVIPPYILDARRPRVASQIPTPPTMQDFSLPTVVSEAPVPPVQTVSSEPMVRPSGGFGSNIEYDYYTFLNEIGYNDTPVAREMFKRYQDKMNARSMQDGFNTNPKIFGDNAIGFSNNPEQLAVPSMGENYSIAGEQPVALNKQGPYPLNPMSTGGGFNPQTRPSFDSARMMEINNPMGESIGANAVGSGPAVPAMQPQVTGPALNPVFEGKSLKELYNMFAVNGGQGATANPVLAQSLTTEIQAREARGEEFNVYDTSLNNAAALYGGGNKPEIERQQIVANTSSNNAERLAAELVIQQAELQAKIDNGTATQLDIDSFERKRKQSNVAQEIAIKDQETLRITSEQQAALLAPATDISEANAEALAAQQEADTKRIQSYDPVTGNYDKKAVPPVVKDPAMDNREKVIYDLELNNGSGLNTSNNGKVTDKNGADLEPPTEAEIDATAKGLGSDTNTLLGKLGPIFKSLFGLETQDMTRALGFYLMSRASGASHAGSMRWAGGTVLKQAEARGIRNDAKTDAAIKAFAGVKNTYTTAAASKINKLLSEGKLLEAQTVMSDPKSKTFRGRYGIDADDAGTPMMRPGSTKPVLIFTGTDGQVFKKITVDGKEGFVKVSTEEYTSLRERAVGDNRSNLRDDLESAITNMNSTLFRQAGTDKDTKEPYEGGMFGGQDQQGVIAAIMKKSDELGALGLDNIPTDILDRFVNIAELAESQGIKKINPTTLLDMIYVGGQGLVNTEKLTTDDGEMLTSSQIGSFTDAFKEMFPGTKGQPNYSAIQSTFAAAEANADTELFSTVKGVTEVAKALTDPELTAAQIKNISSMPNVYTASVLLEAFKLQSKK